MAFDDAAHAARLQDFRAAVDRSRLALGDTRHRLAEGGQPKPAAAVPVPTQVAFQNFSAILSAEGVRPALVYLVGLTDYRFLSIFRFQSGKATSVVHVDREDPGTTQAAEVADTATYCCFVRDGNGAFVTADAVVDARAEGHPARQAVPAYCGIPIMDPEGSLIGTLCHYDVVPRNPEALDLELLLQVASRLARPGIVPPYPKT